MKLLKIFQIIIALLLMAAILLQSRGVGLGGIFGGTDAIYRTKRGIEKTLFIATIILAVLFFLVALASVFIGAK
jgi:preprotein translocase subunit SecG